ncbi:lysylphosphatidylglycerol synthase domain-containing protein [Angustibacter luteus]|uniref:Lysylphosphatidylglycerol synthase domain-containing protein n=1 Tax=Angustibacter luteus TaxID=658456 RepID=A0ABW1JI98_9ACTN
MSRTAGRWLRVAGGAAILAALLWQVGAGPFVDGLRTVDARALAVALAIGAITTACCAWRWTLVAHGHGIHVPFRAAAPAYYRSQFLNATLPGGVLGDVERAVRHGRAVAAIGRSTRAVVWERTAGQGVQLALAVGVLLLAPSVLRPHVPVPARGLAVGAAVVLALAVCAAATRTRAARAAAVVALTSTVAVGGHVAVFLVAARTAGSQAPVSQLLPLALVVLVAMGIPLNVAGWGPREGVAAWAFAAAGLGAAQGISTAVVYGVMALVASLPGLLVLLVDGLRGRAAALPSLPEAVHG